MILLIRELEINFIGKVCRKRLKHGSRNACLVSKNKPLLQMLYNHSISNRAFEIHLNGFYCGSS